MSKENIAPEEELDLKAIQIQIDQIYTDLAKGAFIRSRAKWLEEGERNLGGRAGPLHKANCTTRTLHLIPHQRAHLGISWGGSPSGMDQSSARAEGSAIQSVQTSPETPGEAVVNHQGRMAEGKGSQAVVINPGWVTQILKSCWL